MNNNIKFTRNSCPRTKPAPGHAGEFIFTNSDVDEIMMAESTGRGRLSSFAGWAGAGACHAG